MNLKPKYKYQHLEKAEVFCYKKEKIFIFQGNTKEDKVAKVKKDWHVIEIMNFQGENLYASEVKQQGAELRFHQYNEFVQIYMDTYDEQNQCRFN